MLVAVAGITQMLARLHLGPLMRKFPDKQLVIAATIALALSTAILFVSTTLFAFVLSQLFQGIARAYFWTGNQTHAVRTSHSPARALALLNYGSGAGSLIAPLIAGLLYEYSALYAFALATVFALLSTLTGVLLIQLRPFAPLSSIEDRPTGRLWRRPAVRDALVMSTATGAWWGLLGSYVPVLLVFSGQSATTIGILVTVATFGALLGNAVISTWRPNNRTLLILGLTSIGLGLAALGPLGHLAFAAALTLAISGLGAGALQTIAPVIATESSHSEESGDAIATTGMVRAGTLLVTPIAVAGIVLVAPVSVAFVAVGLLIFSPTLLRLGPDDKHGPTSA